mgnify:CR=1 FL=1
MGNKEHGGRVTIPTNLDVVPETIELMKRWGADAIRDCDGTEFPEELTKTGAKIYATYYTTRKDNAWAKAHPEEIQQMYIMTSFHTAVSDTLEIHLMDHLYPDMLAVNTRDDIRREANLSALSLIQKLNIERHRFGGAVFAYEGLFT